MWDSFIEAVTKINDWVNGVVWGWPMIIMILGTGILLTIRTRLLQVRKFGESMSSTIVPAVKDMGKKKDKKDKNSVSQFEAFSAAISGTVGTGNTDRRSWSGALDVDLRLFRYGYKLFRKCFGSLLP